MRHSLCKCEACLRDSFAMATIEGIAIHKLYDPVLISEYAYKLADAMIETRRKYA